MLWSEVRGTPSRPIGERMKMCLNGRLNLGVTCKWYSIFTGSIGRRCNSLLLYPLTLTSHQPDIDLNFVLNPTLFIFGQRKGSEHHASD